MISAIHYTVKPGDNLWNIAGKVYGNPNLWPAIYDANKSEIGDSPNLIYAGERYVIPRHAGNSLDASVTDNDGDHDNDSYVPRHSNGYSPKHSNGTIHGNLGCNGLELLWIDNGGNPAKAFIAAQIAMAESGGEQYSHSPTDDYGYWQINISHGALATYDANGNARAAIEISDNGTDWNPWVTYTSGAYLNYCN